MTVNELFVFVQFLARKNQTGNIAPTEFHNAFNSSQRSYFNHLLGAITIQPHVALGNNERISERLKPFKVNDGTVAVTSQVATYPTNFIAITAMTNAANDEAMVFMDDAKLKKRLKSAIDPIADADPAVFTNTSTGWKIWPATVTSIKVSYYIIPADVVWGYTLDGSSRPVYSSGTSTQPLWDNLALEEILGKTCMLLGFSFEKQSLVQYGATKMAEV